MAGRPPKHDFNLLEIGQRTPLKGKAKLYPSQYINQFNKTGKKLKLIREDGKIFVERIK
jgi:hypothetical protein